MVSQNAIVPEAMVNTAEVSAGKDDVEEFIEEKLKNLAIIDDDKSETSVDDEDDDYDDDDEEEDDDDDEEEEDEDEDKPQNDDLRERGPMRFNDRHAYHPYQQQQQQQQQILVSNNNFTVSTDTELNIDKVIVPSLTDEQLLELVNRPDFKDFIEDEAKKSGITTIKPRRESEDSSYYSDGSPYSYGNPATPQDSNKKLTAKEAFKNSLKEDVKRKEWVSLHLLDNEEVFQIENGRSRLHRLLDDNNPHHLPERFYTLVEVMSRDKNRFFQIIRMQPSIQSLIEEKHPEFLDYFKEVEISLY